MPLFKQVGPDRIELTPDEEAAVRAEWIANAEAAAKSQARAVLKRRLEAWRYSRACADMRAAGGITQAEYEELTEP